MSQLEEYTRAIYLLIQRQRGIKAGEIAAEVGRKRSTVSKWLGGSGSEQNLLALDRAITAISDRRGGPLKMTGAGPGAAEGFRSVLRDARTRGNGWGMPRIERRMKGRA